MGSDSICLCLRDSRGHGSFARFCNRCPLSAHSATDVGVRGVLQFLQGSVAFWDMSNKVTVLCFLILQMLIFSLGRTLQRVVKNSELDGGNLKAVLDSMVRPNPATRASLMDLFDVSRTASRELMRIACLYTYIYVHTHTHTYTPSMAT
jgi:hypothetical protein